MDLPLLDWRWRERDQQLLQSPLRQEKETQRPVTLQEQDGAFYQEILESPDKFFDFNEKEFLN